MPRNWSAYNNQLVKRGEIYFSMDFLDSWERELASMNRGRQHRLQLHKKGIPHAFAKGIEAVSLHPYRDLFSACECT